MAPIKRLTLRLPTLAAALALALALSGCGRRQESAAWWSGEQERMELSHQLELQEFRLEGIYTGDFAQLEGVRIRSQVTSARVVSLHQEQQELGGTVAALQGKLTAFKESTRHSQRQRAMHQTFKTLCLASGRKFENVTVSVIDDSGVMIRHSHGSARLQFYDLDAEQQRFFGLEADLAHTAHENEARDAVAYEHWIEERMQITRLSKAADANVGRRREIASIRKQPDSPTLQIFAANTRPLAQPARSVGSGDYRSNHYSNYRKERSAYRYVYYDAPNCTNHPSSGNAAYSPQCYPTEFLCKPTVSVRQSFSPNTTIPSTP